MQTKIIFSQEFAVFFLLLLTAGYEKNTDDRFAFDEEAITQFLNLVQQEKVLSDFVKVLQQLPVEPAAYVRLAHYVLCSPESVSGPFSNVKQNKIAQQWWDDGAKKSLQIIIKNESVQKILNNHQQRLNAIPDYTKECLLKELQQVIDFLHLSFVDAPALCLHVNGFERLGRATNYNGKQKLVVAPIMAGAIAWRSVRHEFLHFIIKKIFPHQLGYQYGITPVPEEYKNDPVRVQFEENCVAALSLFFLPEPSRQNNRRYFHDRGFLRIDELVEFFSIHCQNAREPLSAELLQQLCQQLQKNK